jgi:hypothetical protein
VQPFRIGPKRHKSIAHRAGDGDHRGSPLEKLGIALPMPFEHTAFTCVEPVKVNHQGDSKPAACIHDEHAGHSVFGHHNVGANSCEDPGEEALGLSAHPSRELALGPSKRSGEKPLSDNRFPSDLRRVSIYDGRDAGKLLRMSAEERLRRHPEPRLDDANARCRTRLTLSRRDNNTVEYFIHGFIATPANGPDSSWQN